MWPITKPFPLGLREDRGVKTGGRREGETNIPPVPPPLYRKDFRTKKGVREGYFEVEPKNQRKNEYSKRIID